MQLLPIADQVVLITGASSGIGLTTARTMARRGARVFLVARNGEALEEIAAGIAADGGEAGFAIADVGDRSALRIAARAAVGRFGRIDTWVNCAGVAIYAALVDTPFDEHERLFRTNYFGVVNGAQVAVEHLRERGGALITIGSIAGDMPSPVMGAYAASKHAVKGFVESLRIELVAAGVPIAVTLVKPSGISTPIARHAANHVDGEALIPPPVYDPALVAEAIVAAAQHATRDVTVGGIGRLQVLAANHFPGLFVRLAGLIMPLLSDRSRPRTIDNNLASPARDGDERSAVQPGRGVSLYAHRTLGAAVVAGAIGAGLMVSLARRRRTASLDRRDDPRDGPAGPGPSSARSTARS